MYQALYRKYRPKTFDEIVGQEHVTTILKNQIENNQISHAYLFSGTRGTGKTSCAKIFARAVNCLEDGPNPCNKCENCLESLDNSSIDIIEIDAASNNGVDNIRDLKDRAFYKPASLKYKVYIIDEVHMLSKGAFNALLKILEEPPVHLIFILATTEPEKIPLTILSRCQKFQFKRITSEEIVKSLEDITIKEGLNVDKEALKLLATNADGSMRDAESLLEQVLASDTKNITYEMVVEALGIVDDKVIGEIVDSLILKNPQKLLSSLDIAISSGKDIETLSKNILNYYRNLMIAKVSKDSVEKFITSNGEVYIEKSNNISLEEILYTMEKLIENINQIKYSAQKRTLLEISLIEILNSDKNSISVEKVSDNKNINKIKTDNRVEDKHLDKEPTIKTPENTKNNIENKIEEISSENKSNEKIVDNSNLNIDIIKNDWNNIKADIRSKNPRIGALIFDGNPKDFEGNKLFIEYDESFGFHIRSLNDPKNRQVVENAISMFYNTNIIVEVVESKADTSLIDEDIENLKNIIGEDNITII